MEYTHPIDRLVYRLRWPIVWVAAISAPVFLFSYGKMMILAYDAWSGWAFGLAFTAHLVTLLSVASLFDSQQERRQSKEDGQSEAHRRP